MNIVKPDSASHWYKANDEEITSFHTVPYAGKRGKAGETRSTSLRDARKVGALPSVTNILQILQKDFLTAYKINQAILACTTLPKIEGESVDDFAKRALADSKEHAASAARLGSRCHELGAGILTDPRYARSTVDDQSEPPSGMSWVATATKDTIAVPDKVASEFVGERSEGRDIMKMSMPLIELIQEITPEDSVSIDEEFSEFYIANREIGYAGCCDGLIYLNTGNQDVRDKLIEAGFKHEVDGYCLGGSIVAVCDIKTRGVAAKKAPVYETDILQLAAYTEALSTTPNINMKVNSGNMPACNLMLNTNPKAGKDGVWEAELIVHKKEDVEKAWETFKHLHAVWCWMKNYDPATTQKK